MDRNEYLKIVYTGIAENSNHLLGYIQREQKKAENEFVEEDEFFERLMEAVKSIKTEFVFKHGIRLDQHYKNINRDEAAPEGKKFDYPKELPNINDMGLPLFHYTQKYTGDFYFNQVEQFENALIEVKNIKSANTSLEFSINNLSPKILPFTKERGYFSFTPILETLLSKARQYDDIEIEAKLLLNVHELCKENAKLFWSETHRKQVSDWLNSSPFKPTKLIKIGELKNGEPEMNDVLLFSTTWEVEVQQETTTEIKGEKFTNLKELFIETMNFDKAIKALLTLKVIDTNNSNIIGSKLKGVMQVWINILRNDRRQLKVINDKDLTVLLNNHFENLCLSEKTEGKHFRNTINKTASNQYRAKLLALL